MKAAGIGARQTLSEMFLEARGGGHSVLTEKQRNFSAAFSAAHDVRRRGIHRAVDACRDQSDAQSHLY